MGLAKLGSAPRGIGAAKRARSETGAKPTTKKSLKGGKAAKAASEASASEAAAWLAEHDVSLSDPAAPAPCVRLADAPFPAALVAKLVAQPGFSAPTAVQGGAWPVAAAGDDLLAISRTGSGKTLSYSNPSASRSPSPNPFPTRYTMRSQGVELPWVKAFRKVKEALLPVAKRLVHLIRERITNSGRKVARPDPNPSPTLTPAQP